MANTFKLKIMTPDKIKFEEDVISVLTKTENGKVEILANHAAIVINTIPCITEITRSNGEKIELFTSTGVIGFKKNVLDFCCEASETREEIDSGRAQEAKQRAEKHMKEENFDKERAELALARALTRLELKKR